MSDETPIRWSTAKCRRAIRPLSSRLKAFHDQINTYSSAYIDSKQNIKIENKCFPWGSNTNQIHEEEVIGRNIYGKRKRRKDNFASHITVNNVFSPIVVNVEENKTRNKREINEFDKTPIHTYDNKRLSLLNQTPYNQTWNFNTNQPLTSDLFLFHQKKWVSEEESEGYTEIFTSFKRFLAYTYKGSAIKLTEKSAFQIGRCITYTEDYIEDVDWYEYSVLMSQYRQFIVLGQGIGLIIKYSSDILSLLPVLTLYCCEINAIELSRLMFESYLKLIDDELFWIDFKMIIYLQERTRMDKSIILQASCGKINLHLHSHLNLNLNGNGNRKDIEKIINNENFYDILNWDLDNKCDFKYQINLILFSIKALHDNYFSKKSKYHNNVLSSTDYEEKQENIHGILERTLRVFITYCSNEWLNPSLNNNDIIKKSIKRLLSYLSKIAAYDYFSNLISAFKLCIYGMNYIIRRRSDDLFLHSLPTPSNAKNNDSFDTEEKPIDDSIDLIELIISFTGNNLSVIKSIVELLISNHNILLASALSQQFINKFGSLESITWHDKIESQIIKELNKNNDNDKLIFLESLGAWIEKKTPIKPRHILRTRKRKLRSFNDKNDNNNDPRSSSNNDDEDDDDDDDDEEIGKPVIFKLNTTPKRVMLSPKSVKRLKELYSAHITPKVKRINPNRDVTILSGTNVSTTTTTTDNDLFSDGDNTDDDGYSTAPETPEDYQRTLQHSSQHLESPLNNKITKSSVQSNSFLNKKINKDENNHITRNIRTANINLKERFNNKSLAIKNAKVSKRFTKKLIKKLRKNAGNDDGSII